MDSVFNKAQRLAVPALRISLGIVLLWIGALKFIHPEPVVELLGASFGFLACPGFIYLLGAAEVTAAVMLLLGVYQRWVGLVAMTSHSSHPALVPHLPEYLIEAWGLGLFMVSALGFTGLFAGLLVASYIIVEAPLSGMSMNPARTLASAIGAQSFGALWIYFTAPPLGMLLAAQIYLGLRGAGRVRCAKLHHQNEQRCIFRCGYEDASRR